MTEKEGKHVGDLHSGKGGEIEEQCKQMEKEPMVQWSPLVMEVTPKSNGTITMATMTGTQMTTTMDILSRFIVGEEPFK